MAITNESITCRFAEAIDKVVNQSQDQNTASLKPSQLSYKSQYSNISYTIFEPPTITPLPEQDRHILAQTPNDIFRPIAFFYSYATCMARVMYDQVNDNFELWINAYRYSNTTNRHMSLLYKALSYYTRLTKLDAYDFNYAHFSVLRSRFSDGEAWHEVRNTLIECRRILETCASRYSRGITNIQRIEQVKARLQEIHHMVTHNAPSTYLPTLREQPAYRELTSMMGFVENVFAFCDGEPTPADGLKVKPSVQAFFALER